MRVARFLFVNSSWLQLTSFCLLNQYCTLLSHVIVDTISVHTQVNLKLKNSGDIQRQLKMNEDSNVVVAEIQYLSPDPLYDKERPYSIAAQPPPGIKRTNIVQAGVKTRIHNARGKEDQFSLHVNGFEWTSHNLDYGLDSDQAIDRYLDEMGSFLQRHLKASRVIVYDFVVIW